MEELLKALIDDKHFWLSSLGVFALLRAMNTAEEKILRVAPQKWIQAIGAIYRRLLPVLPEAFGTVAVLIGSVPMAVAFPLIGKVAVGAAIGMASQRAHKLIGQTLLGDDRGAQLPAIRARVEVDTDPDGIEAEVVPEEEEKS